MAEPIQQLLSEPLVNLEAKFDRSLEAFARCWRERTAAVEFPDLGGELAAVDAAVVRVRDEGVGASADYAAVAQLLALVNRYRAIAGRLGDCRQQLAHLELDRCLHDVVL